MTTTDLITPPRADSASPSVADILRETVPLVGFIPVAGPPVLLVAGPRLLFALMLVGYFAPLGTVVALRASAPRLAAGRSRWGAA